MDSVLQPPSWRKQSAVLAILVHVLFFALLYFGVSLKNEPPATMSVDLWASLPAVNVSPPPAPPQEPVKPVEPVKPIEPVVPPAPKPQPKPDIVIEEKKPEKKPEKKTEPKVEPKPVEKKPEPKPVEKKEAPAKPVVKSDPAAAEFEAQLVARVEAQKRLAEQRAAQAAAAGKALDDYKTELGARIKSKIIMANADELDPRLRVKFSFRVLPDGSVINVKMDKPSGDPQWDEAVRVAIEKSRPLPYPTDPEMQKVLRNSLSYSFGPRD